MITPESLAVANTETGHQQALFCYFALSEVHNKYPDTRWLFAVPNGAWRNKIVATRLRAEGVKSGVPDIWLPIKRGNWSGLVIELKKLPAKVTHKRPEGSKEQKEWMELLNSQDYGVAVCVGWIEARDMIINYLEYKVK